MQQIARTSWMLSCLLVACIALPVSARPPEVPARCITLAQADASMTPPTLLQATQRCLAEQRPAAGSDLYVLAMLFARYDTFRVADASAHGIVPLMTRQLSASMEAASRTQLDQGLVRASTDPQEILRLCQRIGRIGAPRYQPIYMADHSMSAIRGEDAIAPAYDGPKIWASLLVSDLRCAAH